MSERVTIRCLTGYMSFAKKCNQLIICFAIVMLCICASQCPIYQQVLIFLINDWGRWMNDLIFWVLQQSLVKWLFSTKLGK